VEPDQRVLHYPVQQELFEVGLVEHVRLREAVQADLVLAAELGHDAVAGVEQAQPAAGAGPRQESLADADPAKRPGDFVVEVDGPRQRMGLEVAFQQGDGNALVGEQEGRGAADRAGTDDDDAVPAAGVCLGVGVLVVHGGGPLWAVRAVRDGSRAR
jgi:hypothetical protein